MAAAQKSQAEQIRESAISRLTEVRSQIAPLVEEESLLTSMVPDQTEVEPVAAPKPQAAQPAAPKRRKRQGGTRADQAVAHIAENPGVGASDIAKAMKIKPNYLYRVLGDLEKEGRVKKDGRSYEVTAAA